MAILGGPTVPPTPAAWRRSSSASASPTTSIEIRAMSFRPSPSPTHMNTLTAEHINDRTRWLALYVLCAGMLMIVLDATIVNVALPTIQDDLGFTQSKLAWVV